MTRMKRCLPTVRIHQNPVDERLLKNGCPKLHLHLQRNCEGNRWHCRGDCKEQVAQPDFRVRLASNPYLWANEPNGFRPNQVNLSNTCQGKHWLDKTFMKIDNALPMQIELKTWLK